MKFDLHTHHFRCGHADGTIEDYIQAAIEQAAGIGISDHSPYFASEHDQPQPGSRWLKVIFRIMWMKCFSLKDKYEGRIEVLLGMESDFYPGACRALSGMLTSATPSITSLAPFIRRGESAFLTAIGGKG